jgi:hypothetical protein
VRVIANGGDGATKRERNKKRPYPCEKSRAVVALRSLHIERFDHFSSPSTTGTPGLNSREAAI